MEDNEPIGSQKGDEKSNLTGLYLMVGIPLAIFVLILLHEAGLF